MTPPVTVAQFRDRARRLFDRESRAWAASGERGAFLDLPLHPPTERAALADLEGTRRWVDEWRQAESSSGIEVAWSVRAWSRVGSQRIPDRARVSGAEPIAAVCGEERAWSTQSTRLDVLRDIVGSQDASIAMLRIHARAITALSGDDFLRLLDVLSWLGDNPDSGRLMRELPIRGIDSKWVESRRGVVEALHRAATGRSGLGLREPSPLVRMRVLDPALALDGVRDVSSPVEELAALPWRPERVLVVENLSTVLAMPDIPGAVVLDGGGHRVDLIARIPWARDVTYWGDLDSHGFAIVNRLRALGVTATSVLMDTRTLLVHRDLWGLDPSPNIGALRFLTESEQATLRLLGTEGNVRLEQERIPWSYAVTQLGIVLQLAAPDHTT